MSHALLLRLFLSPSFFTVHVALQYLGKYPDNIGITYYITRRLRELDTQDLRDVWGFICHLAITRPSKSRALECFIVEIAERSTHVAMITLWFMQAALQDLSFDPKSASFTICQRILHKCHEIIFGDLPAPMSGPYASLGLSPAPLLRLPRRKVKPNFEPALVGISMMLVGVPALPLLTSIVGEVAIEQGRIDDDAVERSLETKEDDIVHGVSPVAPGPSLAHGTEETPARPGKEKRTLPRRNTVLAAQTSPALALHLHDLKRSRMSEDPLGQMDSEQVSTPFQSSPLLASPSGRPSPRFTNSQAMSDVLLRSYDPSSQMHMLQSHYCRSEVQFLLALESICNRLLVVPRPARVSALRAELTALNHKLPAEVCMPMWCSSSDTRKAPGSVPQPHHRIVRVPPGESVVLNSAERAPYLLLIEVLNDDLDFDPTKRVNKEVLKKMVTKENEKKGTSRDIIPFSTKEPLFRHKLEDSTNGTDVSVVDDVPAPPTKSPMSSLQALPTTLADNEEMDLVEQLYGNDQSLHAAFDLSDSIVLPLARKNRELDMATWSSSIPSTPNPMGAVETEPAAFPSPLTSRQNSIQSALISMDEYSERMRTAAIMLAQLNANLARETAAAAGSSSDQSNSRSWLPTPSWGASGEPPAQVQMPTKLQASEANGIRDRIMQEMLALEEERMQRMTNNGSTDSIMRVGDLGSMKTPEDEGIIRRELNKADPSAVVFSESWATKKSRIRHNSPYGHLANWDCVSVIVKTGGDLRQEQLATQLIRQFLRIWEEENSSCWVRYFRIVITGGSSGLVETITDAVSIHSIKKAEYARRLTEGRLGHVTLVDHFKTTYGDSSSAKYIRAQRNFAKSLAGYSLVTYLLQIKDRHNGNILIDRDGHLIHIDFGFILSNTPGNIGFEAAPFKLPPEYVDVLGGVTSPAFLEFRRLFREGFEAARKHCDSIITMVELMQKDSTLPCFAAYGEDTANQLRERFQPTMTHSLVADHVERLINSSLGSNWTKLYDTYQYYSQSIL